MESDVRLVQNAPARQPRRTLGAQLARGRLLLRRLATNQGTLTKAPGDPGIYRVLVITLERQSQRRQKFRHQIARFPILADRLEWLTAVDGVGLKLDEVPRSIVTSDGIADARTPREQVVGYVLTPGAVGLAWSLHQALSAIARDPNENHVYLICEDDAVFCHDFPAVFPKLLTELEAYDPQWEVFHVGYNSGCTTVHPCGQDHCGLGRPTQLFGMYGIALPPEGARKLLKRLFPVSLQVDTELSRLYQNFCKCSGDIRTRALDTRETPESQLRVYAPCFKVASSIAPSTWWGGPLVTAPPSRPDCTDIQVMSCENFANQYSGFQTW